MKREVAAAAAAAIESSVAASAATEAATLGKDGQEKNDDKAGDWKLPVKEVF